MTRLFTSYLLNEDTINIQFSCFKKVNYKKLIIFRKQIKHLKKSKIKIKCSNN